MYSVEVFPALSDAVKRLSTLRTLLGVVAARQVGVILVALILRPVVTEQTLVQSENSKLFLIMK